MDGKLLDQLITIHGYSFTKYDEKTNLQDGSSDSSNTYAAKVFLILAHVLKK